MACVGVLFAESRPLSVPLLGLSEDEYLSRSLAKRYQATSRVQVAVGDIHSVAMIKQIRKRRVTSSEGNSDAVQSILYTRICGKKPSNLIPSEFCQDDCSSSQTEP